MAAAVVIVAAAAVLGYGLLVHDAAQVPTSVTARRADASAAVPDAPAVSVPPVQVASAFPPPAAAGTGVEQAFRPVRVHRAGGPSVELEWDGDGRETAPGGAASPYKVLASASPRDFSDARPVLVAGRRLVTSTDLPSLRTADRSITFFRVE